MLIYWTQMKKLLNTNVKFTIQVDFILQYKWINIEYKCNTLLMS